jgi:TetR/AcrR family transcriptional regulator
MEVKMQTVKLSRKERELQRHRQEILRVALKMFSESGFHGVTMNDIARESEFAVGTLYKFFKNKEDLYGALLMEKLDEIDQVLIGAIESGKDEIDSIRAFVQNLLRLVRKNVKFFRIFHAEIHKAGFAAFADLDRKLKQGHERLLATLADIFERGIQRKVFKNLNPYLLTTALDGIIAGFMLQYFEHGDRYPFDADTIMEIFFGSILLDQPDCQDKTPDNLNDTSCCE